MSETDDGSSTNGFQVIDRRATTAMAGVGCDPPGSVVTPPPPEVPAAFRERLAAIVEREVERRLAEEREDILRVAEENARLTAENDRLKGELSVLKSRAMLGDVKALLS